MALVVFNVLAALAWPLWAGAAYNLTYWATRCILPRYERQFVIATGGAALALLVIAWGLWMRRGWARFAEVAMLVGPFLLVLAARKPTGLTLLFALPSLALAAYLFDQRGVARPAFEVAAVLGTAAIAVILGISALGIASARRGGSAKESATIGDLRTILTIQADEQSHREGAFAPFECLRDPACRHPGTTPGEVLDYLFAPEKSGYRRTFHAGPPVARGLSAFALTAVPIQPGQSGCRTFCADSTGQTCFAWSPDVPRVKDGLCVRESCEIIQ